MAAAAAATAAATDNAAAAAAATSTVTDDAAAAAAPRDDDELTGFTEGLSTAPSQAALAEKEFMQLKQSESAPGLSRSGSPSPLETARMVQTDTQHTVGTAQLLCVLPAVVQQRQRDDGTVSTTEVDVVVLTAPCEIQVDVPHPMPVQQPLQCRSSPQHERLCSKLYPFIYPLQTGIMGSITTLTGKARYGPPTSALLFAACLSFGCCVAVVLALTTWCVQR